MFEFILFLSLRSFGKSIPFRSFHSYFEIGNRALQSRAGGSGSFFCDVFPVSLYTPAVCVNLKSNAFFWRSGFEGTKRYQGPLSSLALFFQVMDRFTDGIGTEEACLDLR